MNALADAKVAEYVNEHFVATYLKVGTFRIQGGQKVGGNVASYFCLYDGKVLHAVPGPVQAPVFLSEARWAVETRKAAMTFSTRLATGDVDQRKYRVQIRQAHQERYATEAGGAWGRPNLQRGTPYGKGKNPFLPNQLPRAMSKQGQVHWMLASYPLAELDHVYPIVWERILNEKLSGLPVAQK